MTSFKMTILPTCSWFCPLGRVAATVIASDGAQVAHPNQTKLHEAAAPEHRRWIVTSPAEGYQNLKISESFEMIRVISLVPRSLRSLIEKPDFWFLDTPLWSLPLNSWIVEIFFLHFGAPSVVS